ncbi:MAG: peptidylprolyl isomerase [Phycisphaeraceae bacterium]
MHRALSATSLILPLLLAACAQSPERGGSLSDRDFVVEPRPVPEIAPASAAVTAPQPNPIIPEAATPPLVTLGSADEEYLERAAELGNPPAPAIDTTTSWVIDGMVGQVNGRAIYARTVLEPIEQQLAQIATRQSERDFEGLARSLVLGRIQEIVQNQLILAAAERDLDDRGRQMLDAMLRFKREEFIREYGRGSLAIAEQQLMLREEVTLNKKIEDFRQTWLIRNFQMKNLRPLIEVRRRDIERYYRENIDRFNPPVEQSVRLIRVKTAEDADRVVASLEAGYSFEEVAATAINQMLGGGVFTGLMGDTPLRQDELNHAIASLEPGGWTGPIDLPAGKTFIQLLTRTEPDRQSLTDAQKEIREILLTQQLRELSVKYQSRLIAEASHTPIEAMTLAVMEIVMTRYNITTATTGG